MSSGGRLPAWQLKRGSVSDKRTNVVKAQVHHRGLSCPSVTASASSRTPPLTAKGIHVPCDGTERGRSPKDHEVQPWSQSPVALVVVQLTLDMSLGSRVFVS